MATPEPLHGRVEGWLVDLSLWKRRALADGRITHEEAAELVTVIEVAVPDVGLLVATQRHIAACAGGADGMLSHRAIRSLDEHRRRKLADDDEAA